MRAIKNARPSVSAEAPRRAGCVAAEDGYALSDEEVDWIIRSLVDRTPPEAEDHQGVSTGRLSQGNDL